jgi:LDH2 family malate/lactate/ureidoglycolate dehydrogenase
MNRRLVVKADPLRTATAKVFQASGAPANEAIIVADHLVTANLMGLDSHGIIRIPQYLEDVQKGIIRPGAPIRVCQETETTAVVECGWNFGQVGAVRAMEVAMAKASRFQTASVVARLCNHVGRLGAYTQMAAQKGFLALGVCNSPRHGHFVLPWGGRKGRLATNPISFAVPGASGDPILADFSTAESSEGKIRLYRNRGTQLPSGWIVDASGRPSTNPDDFYGPPQGAILPFGGATGYRGFALSLLVEILGGVLAGSRTSVDQPGNGLGLVVINISAFQNTQEFASLIRDLHDYMKSSPPGEGFDEVILPGELDFKTRDARLREGIPTDEKTWEQIRSWASTVGVKWDEELGLL